MSSQSAPERHHRQNIQILVEQGQGKVCLLAGTPSETSNTLETAIKEATKSGKSVFEVPVGPSGSVLPSLIGEIQKLTPVLNEEGARILARMERVKLNDRAWAQAAGQRNNGGAIEAVRQLLLSVEQSASTTFLLRGVSSNDVHTWKVLTSLLEDPFHALKSLPSKANRSMPAIWIEIAHEGNTLPKAAESFATITGCQVLMTALTTRQQVRSVLEEPLIQKHLGAFSGGDTDLLRNWLMNAPDSPEDWILAQMEAMVPDAIMVVQLLQWVPSPARLRDLATWTQLDVFTLRCVLRQLKDAQFLENGEDLQLKRSIRNIDLGAPDKAHLEALSRAANSLLQSWELEGDLNDLIHGVHLLVRTRQHEKLERWGMVYVDKMLESDQPRKALHFLDQVLEATGCAERDLSWKLRQAELLQRTGETQKARDMVKSHLLNTWIPEPESRTRQLRLMLEFGFFGELIALPGWTDPTADPNESQLELKSSAHQALGQVKEAIELLRALPPTGPRWVSLGNIFFLQGDEAEAETNYLKACESNHPRSQMRALHNLGLLSMRRGNFSQAEQELRKSLELSTVEQEYFGAALCKVNLAFVLERQERFFVSRAFLLEAIDLLSRENRTRNLCGALVALGDLIRRFGSVVQSRRVLEEARRHAHDAGLIREEADALLKLGHGELERGKWGLAKSYLLESLPGLQDAGHPEETSKAFALLAELALLREDEVEASEWILKLDQLNLPPRSERHADRYLLETLLHKEQPELAAKWAEEAITAARVSNQREPEIRGKLALAKALLAQEREDDAQRVMMEGQELLQALSIHVPDEFRERFMGRAIFEALPRQQDSSTVPTPEDEPLSGSRGQEKKAASRPSGFESILGDAQSLVKTLEEASKLAAVDADIMLRGESGTGKELLATALVKLSGRADKPFVRVNAAALSDELLQSELFGHVKGAFTGAHRTTQGKLEEAHTGTLFLDEVGELSPRAQVMLLRVLQERKFQKLGSPKEVTIDVRILFATNANLEDKVRSGAFRGDLYHRISGLELHVPPLRERGGDIRLLAESFLTSCNQRYSAKARFSEPSIRKATEASWPGNVRELKNRVEKAFIMREGEVVHLHSGLNPEIGKASNGTHEISNLVGGSPHGSLDTTLKKVERQLIENALNETSGNISRAAKLLGMSRPRLSQKVKEYGLKKGEKREK